MSEGNTNSTELKLASLEIDNSVSHKDGFFIENIKYVRLYVRVCANTILIALQHNLPPCPIAAAKRLKQNTFTYESIYHYIVTVDYEFQM